MKIFILDSNAKTLSNLKSFFAEKNGFDVVGTADNGLDGLNGIKEKKPDVVVTDLILGGLDGFGVISQIDTSEIKVMVTTAMCSDEIVARAFSMGVKYVLIKPYDPEVLIRRINDILATPIENTDKGFNNAVSNDLIHIVNTTDKKKQITSLLHDIGITPNLKGFRYLRSAITMVIEDEAIIEAVTKVIYPEIAREYKTTPIRAERAIRHAIETSWKRDEGETITKVFNLPKSAKRPTNSEFIGLAAEYLKK
ncbi:MAG: sporulation transcription factor Spo0A [Clostridiales bacterium]|nr:sporulation transcription factor Spo0A [Clostridiales bacterium]